MCQYEMKKKIMQTKNSIKFIYNSGGIKTKKCSPVLYWWDILFCFCNIFKLGQIEPYIETSENIYFNGHF